MASYQVRPLDLSLYGRHEMLLVLASFEPTATPSDRQRTIDYLVKQHGMSTTTTKSLRYDSAFTRRDGINEKGNVRIGPSAFRQDKSWLANVVFHELIHSDQFHYYHQQGYVFGKSGNTEKDRVLIAVDEFEGFYWAWRNSSRLSLDSDQTAELHREVQLWSVEIDDPPIVALARAGQFDKARLAVFNRKP